MTFLKVVPLSAPINFILDELDVFEKASDTEIDDSIFSSIRSILIVLKLISAWESLNNPLNPPIQNISS